MEKITWKIRAKVFKKNPSAEHIFPSEELKAASQTDWLKTSKSLKRPSNKPDSFGTLIQGISQDIPEKDISLHGYFTNDYAKSGATGENCASPRSPTQGIDKDQLDVSSNKEANREDGIFITQNDSIRAGASESAVSLI